MKVTPGVSNVIAAHGVRSEAQFQIQASAHAFRILSSGLYSDKISAVLREIGCNAADSHIAAGKPDLPIEVKLPHTLDTQFYIKDWGLGLTHEEITGLFTTYFSSNKSHSNEMTGAFGLGSKSPFSYTDSFSVSSAKDGIQRNYTAHLGADGSPVISLLSELPVSADWPTGLMVAFPVEPKDFREFQSKAHDIYRWFKVAPHLIGGEPIPAPDFRLQGSNFLLGEKRASESHAQVLMGNVAYPLNAARLANSDRLVQMLIAAGIQLLMPIGSVMPTASREDLEYDERTRENLTTAIRAAGQELAAMLREKALEPAPTEWERHVRVQQFRKSLPPVVHQGVETLLGCIEDQATRTVLKSLYVDQTVAVPVWVGSGGRRFGLKLTDATLQPAVLPVEACEQFQVWLVYKNERRERSVVNRLQIIEGKYHRRDTATPVLLSYEDRVEVVYADSTHPYPRARHHIRDEGHKVILVTAAYREGTSGAKAYAERIANALGGVPVLSTSTLTVPAIVKTQRGKPEVRRAAFADLYTQTVKKYVRFGQGKTCGMDYRSEIVLSEVPSAGKYYLVAHKKGRRRVVQRYPAEIPDMTTQLLKDSQVDAIMVAYSAMQARGVPLEPIEGAIVLEGGDLAKLKLKDHGWRPLFPTVVQSMQSKEVAKDLGRRLANMPVVNTEEWNFLRVAGLIGLFIKARKDDASFGKYWGPLNTEFPVLASIATEVLTANDQANAEAGTRLHLNAVLEHLPIKMKGSLLKQMTLQELRDSVTRAYPLSRFLHADEFVKAMKEKPADAREFLRRILIPADHISEGAEPLLEAAVG